MKSAKKAKCRPPKPLDSNVRLRDPRSRKPALAPEARQRLERAVYAIITLQEILRDSALGSLAIKHGVALAPSVLFEYSSDQDHQNDIEDLMGRYILDFAVACRFFFQLLVHTDIEQAIEERWPKFIASLKDVFIEMVIYGPFPSKRQVANLHGAKAKT